MTELAPQQFTVTRADLVRYAGASGDFNPIHWSDRVATSVGLPGVIAHGMLTLALAARAVEEWAGGPDRIVEFGAKFTKPVIVPDDETGTIVTVSGQVSAQDDATRTISVKVTCDDVAVLGAMKAVVRA